MRIAECGLRNADCGMRIVECGLWISLGIGHGAIDSWQEAADSGQLICHTASLSIGVMGRSWNCGLGIDERRKVQGAR